MFFNLSEILENPMVKATWEKDVKDTLIKYLICGGYAHNIYLVRYYFCELLNFVNVVSFIYIYIYIMCQIYFKSHTKKYHISIFCL